MSAEHNRRVPPAGGWTTTPPVAVIMPCHNAEATLSQAIESVISQSFTEWELLVVDDGSSDASPRVIQDFSQHDARIRIIRNEKATGAAAARNRALEATQARYVAFLDSDDAWLPNKLAIQMKALREHNAALVCGPYDVIDGAGTIIGQVRPTPGSLSYRGLLANNSVGCLTAVIDRNLCGTVRFDTKLPKSEDYHLWLSILKRGLTGICVPETVALYRVHGATLSSNKFSAARNRWRVYREFEGHGVILSSLYFTAYAVTGVLKMLSMRRNRLPGMSSSR